MKQNSPLLNEELKFTSAKYVPREGQEIGFEFNYKGENKVFSPEQLCAMYLTKLKNVCEAYKIKCKDIVLSVPPYFSAIERQALMDAVNIAQLNCLKLINETTSIGLCYGLLASNIQTELPRYVMFIDMGHSKLTVSVLKFTNTQFSIVAQGWETNLGGRDFDLLIARRLITEFQTINKRSLEGNTRAIIRICEAAERAKVMLSYNNEFPIIIPSLIEDKELRYILKKSEYDKLISPYVQRIIDLCIRVLTEAKISSVLHSIELVGRATKTPLIMQKLKENFKVPFGHSVNSADWIARGCAIQSAIFNSLFNVKDYGIIDYLPFPIDIVYSANDTEEAKISKPLFEKGCNFPIIKVLKFSNRKEKLELQLMYSPQSNPLPLGGSNFLGNYRILADIPTTNNFVVKIEIIIDHNMITYVRHAELIQTLSEESKTAARRSSPENPSEAEHRLKSMVTPLEIKYEVNGLTKGEIEDYARMEKLMDANDERKEQELNIYEPKLNELQPTSIPISRPRFESAIMNLSMRMQNALDRADFFYREIEGNEKYTKKDRDEFVKLIEDTKHWHKQIIELVKDPSKIGVYENEFTVRIQDIENRINHMRHRPEDPRRGRGHKGVGRSKGGRKSAL